MQICSLVIIFVLPPSRDFYAQFFYYIQPCPENYIAYLWLTSAVCLYSCFCDVILWINIKNTFFEYFCMSIWNLNYFILCKREEMCFPCHVSCVFLNKLMKCALWHPFSHFYLSPCTMCLRKDVIASDLCYHPWGFTGFYMMDKHNKMSNIFWVWLIGSVRNCSCANKVGLHYMLLCMSCILHHVCYSARIQHCDFDIQQ